MDQFESKIKLYQSQSGETVSDNIRVGIVVSKMGDGVLWNHLFLNMSKFTTYQLLREEIDNYNVATHASSSWGDNMQVDALNQYKPWKGGKKEKGKYDKGK